MSLILKEKDYLVWHKLDSLDEFDFEGNELPNKNSIDSLDEFDFEGKEFPSRTQAQLIGWA